jgi:hypothetical protein
LTVTIVITFFFVFEKKKMTTMHQRIFLWFYCSEKVVASFFGVVAKKKKTTTMRRHLFLWFCCNEEGTNCCLFLWWCYKEEKCNGRNYHRLLHYVGEEKDNVSQPHFGTKCENATHTPKSEKMESSETPENAKEGAGVKLPV